MSKAYWVSTYRAVKDPDKLAAYAKLAGPALTGGGGRFLARGRLLLSVFGMESLQVSRWPDPL